MMPRPPSTTLFPYTTPFRSRHRQRRPEVLAVDRLPHDRGELRHPHRVVRKVVGAPRDDQRHDRIEDAVVAEHLAVDERSEEHTSELQSRQYLVCRLLLEKKK